MSAQSSLLRLLSLRRRSEARALDAVTRAERACHRAEQAVKATALAFTQQVAQARIREHAMIDTVLGRPVPSNVLAMLELSRDTLGRNSDALRDRKTTMEAGLAQLTEALGRAREEYRSRQRAASKLDLTVERQARDRARREAALGEALDEDLASGRFDRNGVHHHAR